VFELVEEAFDQVALLVDMPIVIVVAGAGSVERDDGLCPLGVDGLAEVVGVVGLVGQDVACRQALDERLGLGDVVALAAGEEEAHRIAERVDGDMELAGQPAPAAADGAIFRPPFLPVACWCARTMVESMIRYSKSGSSAKASNSRHQTPSLDQREKR